MTNEKWKMSFEAQPNLARRLSFAPSKSFSYTLIPNIAFPTASPNDWQHLSEARGFGFPKRR